MTLIADTKPYLIYVPIATVCGITHLMHRCSEGCKVELKYRGTRRAAVKHQINSLEIVSKSTWKKSSNVFTRNVFYEQSVEFHNRRGCDMDVILERDQQETDQEDDV
jgi:hypothetical protein